MGTEIRFGTPARSIQLRRSRRARRMTLRVSRLDGRVTLSVPAGVSERDAVRFLEANIDWIESAQQKVPREYKVGLGTQLPIQGSDRRIEFCSDAKVRLTETALFVGSEPVGPRIAGFLKTHARGIIAQEVSSLCDLIGRQATALVLRDTRSRWGSCTTQGRLMFSWRLILAPRDVLSYVVAHEVAHLRHMNHSAAFWDQVSQLCPDYQEPRAWLRQHGATLHRYRFTD